MSNKSAFLAVLLSVPLAGCASAAPSGPAALEGTWRIVSGRYVQPSGATEALDSTRLRSTKLLGATHYAYITTRPDGSFVRSGGGPWTADGKQYVEYLAYTSNQAMRGLRAIFDYRLEGDTWTTVGTVLGIRMEEVWHRVGPEPVPAASAGPPPAAGRVTTPAPTAPGRETVHCTEEPCPVFTPYTVAPELANRTETAQALVREYPAELKAQGIGGRAQIWLHVQADGTVDAVRPGRPSDQPALDAAALRVAKSMRFKPAFNRDQPVAVWILIPIEFRSN